jgi:hypothetical protein
MNHLRKTHPMVLIAAIALTIFSVVGSAAITGLIPSAPQTEVQNKTMHMGNEHGATENSQQYNRQYNEETADRFYQGTERGLSGPLVMVRA